MAMKRTGNELADLVRIAPQHDTNGNPVPPGLAVTHTHTAAGLLATSTQTDGTDTWVRTMTYDAAGNRTGDSGWVAQ
ncbi:MAG: hypothetical protein IPG66_05840 [Hydrogenophilales bacterium]|nr:hypothetical protein [Hydrogenophilales bacterium]